MAKKAKSPSPFEGRWRITAMKVWSQDVVDAEVEGFVEFGPNGLGSFQFAYVSGDIDYRDGTRDGKPSVEWSWAGNDEMDPAKGSGWAVILGDEIRGVIAIHHGDKSEFEATRKEQTGSKTRAIKKSDGRAKNPKLFHAQAPALASSSASNTEARRRMREWHGMLRTPLDVWPSGPARFGWQPWHLFLSGMKYIVGVFHQFFHRSWKGTKPV